MHLNLRDQLKWLCNLYRVICELHGNQKPETNNRHTRKRKESKHKTKNSHQIIRKEGKRKKEQKKNHGNNQKTINKMTINTCLSLIILNVNGLNAPIKRHRVAEWIEKQNPHICCLQEIHFRSKDTYRLSDGMEKGIPCKWKSKENQDSNTCITENRF